MLGSVGVVARLRSARVAVRALLHVDPRTFVPPMMFNNCGNMGLPLAVLAFGAAGLRPMVALFTISNLLHFTLGVWIINHHAAFGNLLRNPMVVATFAGFAFALAHPPLPEWLTSAIKMVGDALIPMMLLSLGVRLAEVPLGRLAARRRRRPRVPAHRHRDGASLLGAAARPRRDAAGLLILFGCLPPAVLNFMVAEQFRAGAGQGRVDRADRQRAVDRLRAARPRARAALTP